MDMPIEIYRIQGKVNAFNEVIDPQGHRSFEKHAMQRLADRIAEAEKQGAI